MFVHKHIHEIKRQIDNEKCFVGDFEVKIGVSHSGSFTCVTAFLFEACVSYLVQCVLSSFSEFSTGIRSTTSCCSLGLLFRTTWKSCSTCLTSSPQSASSKSFLSSIYLFLPPVFLSSILRVSESWCIE